MTTLNLDHFQDVLGQLPRLKTYTHVVLGFHGASPDALIASIKTAARVLVDAFPWLAYRVVHEVSDPGTSGTFRLAPCPEFTFPNTIVNIRDCRNICPAYGEMLNAQGPVSALDGSILSPVPSFPTIYDDAELNPAPVFTLQVNLVQGGVLLDAAAQHNFIDGGGLLRLLELLAKAMRHEPFSAGEIEHGNRDRSNLIPLLRPEEPMLDHSHLIREPLGNSAPTSLDRPDAHWGFVRFPAPNATLLKDRSNKDIQQAHPGSFVSTNDALSAFIWKCVAGVRLRRRQKPGDVSRFSRALDARRALQVPREYLGQMGYNATCHLKFHELQSMSLGEIALFMRRAVEEVNNEYSVRSWATFIAREPDKSRIMFGGSFDPDKDIGLSSMIHASVNGVEFGALGKPDLVRRPRSLPLESCIYLWAQTIEGHVDALLCLKKMDWEALRADAEWARYTEFIG